MAPSGTGSTDTVRHGRQPCLTRDHQGTSLGREQGRAEIACTYRCGRCRRPGTATLPNAVSNPRTSMAPPMPRVATMTPISPTNRTISSTAARKVPAQDCRASQSTPSRLGCSRRCLPPECRGPAGSGTIAGLDVGHVGTSERRRSPSGRLQRRTTRPPELTVNGSTRCGDEDRLCAPGWTCPDGSMLTGLFFFLGGDEQRARSPSPGTAHLYVRRVDGRFVSV